jgi:MFS family permease
MVVAVDCRSQTRAALAVLAACFLLNMANRGAMDAYAVFLLPITHEFGWDRTSVSGVYSVAYVVVGFSGPLIGWILDRFGPARLYLLGIACQLAALLTAANATQLWHFYAIYSVLTGIAVACLGVVPIAALISRWFRRRLTTALALAYSSGSFGMLAIAPLTQALIDRFGWRDAYLGLAGLTLLTLPLVLLIIALKAGEGRPDYRAAPAGAADGPPEEGMTVRKAFRSWTFWGLIWAFCLTGVGMYAVSLQMPAYLQENGFSAQFSAQAYGALGLMAPAGMLGFGWLGDRIGRRNAVLASYALTLTGIALGYLVGLWQTVLAVGLFVLAFGMSFGSRGPAISGIAATVFRGRHMGRIYGFVTIGMGLGGGLGAWFGGFWHDLTGGYGFSYGFAFVALSLGALPFLLVREMGRA